MRKNTFVACLLSAASVLAMSVGAFAQQVAQNSQPDTESVVVTGSRVIADVTNSPTPLTVVSTEELQATTPTTMADALNKLPIFVGSNNPRIQSGGLNNNSGNALNLRNFGLARTLTLFDGHRVVPTGQDGSIDIDALPQMLMTRVDVVTGGASAVYGSDAITGVVNFVLDKNFEGFKYNLNAGITGRGLAAEQQVGLAAGTSLFDGRGHIEAAFRYYNRDPVRYLDLPYGPRYWGQTGNVTSPTNPQTETPDSRNFWAPTGYISSCGTGCTAVNTQFITPGVLGAFNPGVPTGNTNVMRGGDGGFAIHPTAQGAEKSYQSFLRTSYNIGASTTIYAQASLVQSKNLSTYFDPNIDTGVDRNVFFKNNPFLSPSAQAQLNTGTGNTFVLEKILPELEPFRNLGINTMLDVTVGADGTLLDKFNWDLYFTHGEDRLAETNYHNINNGRLMASEDAVLNSSGQAVCYVSTVPAFAKLYPGCEPVNPFGRGLATVSSENFWAPNTQFIETNTMDNVGGSIAGEVLTLPAGPVKAALSSEARWSSLMINSPDGPFTKPVDCTGLRLCPTAPVNTWGFAVLGSIPTVSQSVWEFAGEVNVPLLKDLPLVQAFDLDLAGRYTDYSASGPVQTWKIGLDYHVNDDIRFRATNSVDIRAPTLTDLYGPYQATVGAFFDNHTNTGGNATVQRSPSNPNLVPEVARTYTAGIVLTPTFIPNLTASIDYYQIHMNNAVTTITGSDATTNVQVLCEATAPAYNSPFCSLFTRPLPYTNTTPANYPTAIGAELLNAANQSLSGVDIEVDYSFDLSDIGLPGSFSLREMVGLQPVNENKAFTTTPYTFTAQPKARSTTFLNYNVGDWGIAIQDQWISGYKKQTTSAPQYFTDPRVKSFNSVDVTVDRKMEFAGGVADVYFTVDNVTDNPGPLWGGLAGSPGFSYPVPAFYPILGRTFTLGVKGSF